MFLFLHLFCSLFYLFHLLIYYSLLVILLLLPKLPILLFLLHFLLQQTSNSFLFLCMYLSTYLLLLFNLILHFLTFQFLNRLNVIYIILDLFLQLTNLFLLCANESIVISLVQLAWSDQGVTPRDSINVSGSWRKSFLVNHLSDNVLPFFKGLSNKDLSLVLIKLKSESLHLIWYSLLVKRLYWSEQ